MSVGWRRDLMAPTGIEVRHLKTCPGPRDDGRCCKPAYRASVWVAAENRRVRRTFPTLAAAKRWRQDAIVDARSGALRVQSTATVREVADEWLREARAGIVTNRSGDRYKPSSIRAYAGSLELRVLPELGDREFVSVTRGDLQRLVDRLVAQQPPLSPSTVQCALLPLRAMYRRALSLDEVTINPTVGLRVPAVRGGRDHVVDPPQASALIEALPTAHDRALWGTALYAGLRRGELLALRWEDVDIPGGQIHVTRSWDVNEGYDVGPKSAIGRRRVPIAARLKTLLAAHRLAGRDSGLVFGENGTRAASPAAVTKRADGAWARAKPKPLERITLHEARHTYASLMIAAGVNAKALSTYMGHANISITLDRYGHLMPGNEAEAATMLDAYLDRATAGVRRLSP